MTDQDHGIPWDDGTTAPFWQAAARGELVVQTCRDCGSAQLYPRPFCLACESRSVEWTTASGWGTVYSQTEVHLRVLPDVEPPYTVAVVDLDEGARLMARVVDGVTRIGGRVRVGWIDRDDGPPFPVLRPDEAH